MTRIGGWLFRRRTIIPLPLALALLLVPEGLVRESTAVLVVGVALVTAGEAVRLWGVRHIGAISRTRSDRLGPLVASGPFAFVRNPLYLGNVALWVGFALSAGLPWLAPVFVAVLAFQYHAIVRWEERLLEERLGVRYRRYAAQVPRWIPTAPNRAALGDLNRDADRALSAGPTFSWPETLYSERGTLIAIVAGYLLIWMKSRL